MFRHVCLVTLCLALSLALLPRPASAAATNNCTSGDLPATAIMNTQVTDEMALGAPIPGSDVLLNVNINCSAAWSNSGSTCDGGGGWALNPVSGAIPTLVPGYSDVYTYAGFPANIGYQFLDGAGQPVPLDGESRHDTGVPIQTGSNAIPIHFRAIKISDDLKSGSFSTQMYLSCNSNEWANGNGSNSIITLGLTAEVITQTCHLDNPDVQVQLPQVARTAFKGVGDGAGSTPFNLYIICDANVDARFNISDVTNLANASDALTLIPGSTASGLGVRLKRNGNPVMLAPNQVFDAGGSEFSIKGNPTALRLSLPFHAEYVQTGEQVVAGSVMAQGMVTIDYN